MDCIYKISDDDFSAIKTKLINNLKVIIDNITNCDYTLSTVPIFSGTCIFCLYKYFKNETCHECWYGKHYGLCTTRNSTWWSIKSTLEKTYKKDEGKNLSLETLKSKKDLYKAYVNIFDKCKNINEIMNAKKTLLLEFLQLDRDLFSTNSYNDLIYLIVKKYWKPYEENIAMNNIYENYENEYLKVSDLVDSKYTMMLKNGYKHDDIIHTIKPKFIKFGSRIRIKGYDKLFILVPVRINKVSLISEDFKSYYCYDFDGISVKPIAGNKILVEDLEKIIGKDKEYTIYFTLD